MKKKAVFLLSPGACQRIYALSNVLLTPHVAGAVGSECRRMERLAVEACRRCLHGEPQRWAVTREQAAIMP